LKHPLAVSEGWHEFDVGSQFRPVIENNYGSGNTDLVVLCSGKIFFDFHQLVTSKDFEPPAGRGVKVLRIEELAPFPSIKLESTHFESVSRDAKICWIQEEPVNQGAFQFAKLHIDRILENLDFEQQEMAVISRHSMHSFCSGAASDNKAQNT